ncbi:fumarylacetoacetate hydrolase-like protein [Trichodelitschia bisporula]|uniref:Fumarylacetoacetase n=1 Tax=Trichodelitschia bisporula TaxID=703511 RepID=A0A6G1HZP3_9PEZI|nr:fumarylacetoacetate hydrolase-like protein [Trichodelitschia bisporula]
MASSWMSIPPNSPFSLSNIPFGIISTAPDSTPRPAIAIGPWALDLHVFASNKGFSHLPEITPHLSVFSSPTLNAFAALGRSTTSAVRTYLQSIFDENTPYPDILRGNPELRATALIHQSHVTMHLPFTITDYTDFYVGLNHALNCTRILRGIGSLQPNYRHLPVGYHGRASSVVVSGTPIRRPSGQILNPAAETPEVMFSACRKLDFELELGCFVAKGNAHGEPVPINEAESYLFGVVLLNDWSARDIQAWEMVPLGPFNAKNFATSVSPWVVTMEALEPFLVPSMERGRSVLKYLAEKRKANVFDINLEVDVTTPAGTTKTVCHTSGRHLLFSFPQMLAHHTVGGCPFNTGDLIGSGTISGADDPATFGSLLENTENGTKAHVFNEEERRTFLQDGDTVTFRGICGEGEYGLVGFGECQGKILPAVEFKA